MQGVGIGMSDIICKFYRQMPGRVLSSSPLRLRTDFSIPPRPFYEVIVIISCYRLVQLARADHNIGNLACYTAQCRPSQGISSMFFSISRFFWPLCCSE